MTEGWICCCEGAIADPHRPAETMRCCGNYVWWGCERPPISLIERLRLEECAAYFDQIAEAHKRRGVLDGDQMAAHWHFQASQVRRKLAQAGGSLAQEF